MSICFGEYLVLRGKLLPRAVLTLLDKQLQNRPHIGELAVRKGWLNWGEVLGVLSAAERNLVRFGQAAMDQGLLTEGQISQLIREQQQAAKSLEDCILELGFMDADALRAEKVSYQRELQSAVEPL